MEANREQHETLQSTDRDASMSNVVYETEYDYGQATDGLTVVIIDAIADAMEVSPTEIVPQISECVDPDALERILRPLPDGTERSGHLTFFLLEYRVTVFGDGTLRITEHTN